MSTADDIRKAAATPRWAALAQIGGVGGDLNNYDASLVREPRLLVPVDLQALVVRAGANDTETMVRLPFRDAEAQPPLDVTDPGQPRPPGVHLLWSVPTALGRGTIVDDPQAPGDPSRRRLNLPVLPDRWVVLRLAVPVQARDPLIAGWVIEADAATATPLTDWPTIRDRTVTLGTAVPLPRLNVHIGGAAWSQCYDATAGRLSLHDPLDDLAGITVVGDALTYLVAGWWSATGDDPLDGVGSEIGYVQRLAQLGWNDPDHPSPDATRRDQASERLQVATTFGLPAPTRYTQQAAPIDATVQLAPGNDTTPQPAPNLASLPLSPALSGFLHEAVSAVLLAPAPTRSTLLHGRLHGVPLAGAPTPDNRPAAETARVALGPSAAELAATLSVSGTGLDAVTGDGAAAGDDQRRSAERLLDAFSAGLLTHLDDANVWADIAQYEHGQGFGSLPGGTEGTDRFVDRPPTGSDPGAGFRPGPVAVPRPATVAPAATVLWSAVARPVAFTQATPVPTPPAAAPPAPSPAPVVRQVPRPAPRYHYPAAPVLAIAGGGRALSAVEREEADGALLCRLSDQVGRGTSGVIAASELLTTIGSAAVPPEVLGLAREALAEDPYLSGWRAARATTDHQLDPPATAARLHAEAALSYAYYAADNTLLASYTGAQIDSAASRQRATEALLRLSMSEGTWAHPEGVTMWGQPWRPVFCDWALRLELGPLPGWELDNEDLAATDAVATPSSVTISGRSPLATGTGGTLAAGIDRWLAQERARDLGGHALADAQTEAALAELRATLAELDLLSLAQDGVREQLLGLRYDRGLLHSDADALADGSRRALVIALPTLMAAGRATLTAARLVDAYGRLLELPVDAPLVPARVAESGTRALWLAPRLTTPARWRFDLVDADSTAVDAARASIDQADPARQVNPIAGFLLPDHMDESLEFFATDGTPLGELLHDPFSDAVSWEIAPGRNDVAPAAGPTDDPDTSHHRVGWIAAGLVAADATARQGTPNRPETESALSALLRAIDTTLWSVDPFGALGTEHVAGLVGRPIAVVAARLSLDVYDDTADRAYADDTLRTGRQAAYAALAQLELPVRLGEITRSDDGLLGYFVDDDYTHFHLVDRVIAQQALPSGRGRGVVSDDGSLAPVPIDHPYVDPTGVLRVHPGQTVRLTLLMHPGGNVYLTSGILPRTSRTLARDWVEPGLRVLAPSLRCGPLLIDADKLRLPKVASFPAEQLFTHRDTPSTWRDDPILAATQAALLPDQSPEVQEGWIRIAPNPGTT